MIEFEKIWKCKYCNTLFDTENEIKNHLEICLYNKRNRACPTCYNIYWGDQDESNRKFCEYDHKGFPNCIYCEKWIDSERQKLLDKINETELNLIKYKRELESYDKE